MAVRAQRKAKDDKISQLAQAKWRSSGLTDEHARKLKLRPLSGEEVRAALETDKPQAGGVLIPYFDVKGKATEFFRIRYLEQLPGFAGVTEKPQRYVQPAGTINEVYLPPLLETSWEEIFKDENVPIYITEGEFKAAAGAACGLATIGLGGVDVWRSKKRGIEILPALAKVKWKERQIIIVYDSDAATNPNVVRAQRQLAQELLNRGAYPSIASLPAGPDGRKQGLDDLLVSEGSEALLAILQEAPAFPESAALWEMNEEVMYVRDPGLVVERSSGRRMDPGKFIAHHYANRHYLETSTTKDGGLVTKKKSLAKRWLEWENRFEAEKITYAPGKGQIVDGAWNTWTGWGCQPKKGDVTPWKRLLDHLFGKEELARAWFERWCAYPLQHPGTKLYSASLIWGREQGTGKSLMAYLLRAIYGQNGIEINSESLQGTFNGWAENRQFVIGDEITAGESRLDKEKLKSMISRPVIPINQKFVPLYTIPDCINYLFNSNHPDALFMDDFDRRFFVWEVLAGKASQEFYDELDRWLNGNERNSGKGPGPAILFDYLLNLDMRGFNPNAAAFETSAKKMMIDNNRSDLGMFVRQLKEDRTSALKPLHSVLGDKGLAECDLFTCRSLLAAYDPENTRRTKITENTLSRELQKAGIRRVNSGIPVRTRLGVVRLVAISNVEKWAVAGPKELAKHYEDHFSKGKF